MQWSCICLLFQIKVIGSQMHLALTSFCCLRRGVDKWRVSHRLSQTETESVPRVPPLWFRHPQGQRLFIQLLNDTCITLVTAVVSLRLLFDCDLIRFTTVSPACHCLNPAACTVVWNWVSYSQKTVLIISVSYQAPTAARRKCFCVWAVCCRGT